MPMSVRGQADIAHANRTGDRVVGTEVCLGWLGIAVVTGVGHGSHVGGKRPGGGVGRRTAWAAYG